MNHSFCTRRQWLSTVGAAATGALLPPITVNAEDLPTSPVAVAIHQSYEDGLLAAMSILFDQLGGLGNLVAGKTVAIKINMVGSIESRVANLPQELTHWTHPAVVAAAVTLIGNAGASRIRVLECCGESLESFESYIAAAGWNPSDLIHAAPRVELENTNGIGSGSSYSRVICPGGGLVFPAFDVNHAYTDCDVMISIPKMKPHRWFGVTLAMKNLYGMTPLTIYGDGAGVYEPGENAFGTRVTVMHNGDRPPSLSAPQEVNPQSIRYGGYRIPRIINDVVSARPIDLAIIDGIQSIVGGEGPWVSGVRPISPGLLIAGRNAVCTDTVAMAIMGFDPLAPGGSTPFTVCDNFLALAEQIGLGTRDLNRIEVRGTPLIQAQCAYRDAVLTSDPVAARSRSPHCGAIFGGRR